MVQPEFNILITAASRRVAMIRGFATAMMEMGIDGSVQATDTDKNSPGLRFCDKFHLVPLSGSEDYISAILDICMKENIDLVVPTIDEELPLFGKNKKKFEDEGIIPLVSDELSDLICNDKYKTAQFFIDNHFPFAQTMLPDEIDFETIKYPLFIKPRVGRGSVKAFPVKNEKELRFFLEYVEDAVIQPFLEGAEYTIDVLAGLDGRILSVVPRERIVIRSGVCDRGRTCKDQKLMEVSKSICEKLEVVGPVNLQCMVKNQKKFIAKPEAQEISFFELDEFFKEQSSLLSHTPSIWPVRGWVTPTFWNVRLFICLSFLC